MKKGLHWFKATVLLVLGLILLGCQSREPDVSEPREVVIDENVPNQDLKIENLSIVIEGDTGILVIPNYVLRTKSDDYETVTLTITVNSVRVFNGSLGLYRYETPTIAFDAITNRIIGFDATGISSGEIFSVVVDFDIKLRDGNTVTEQLLINE